MYSLSPHSGPASEVPNSDRAAVPHPRDPDGTATAEHIPQHLSQLALRRSSSDRTALRKARSSGIYSLLSGLLFLFQNSDLPQAPAFPERPGAHDFQRGRDRYALQRALVEAQPPEALKSLWQSNASQILASPKGAVLDYLQRRWYPDALQGAPLKSPAR